MVHAVEEEIELVVPVRKLHSGDRSRKCYKAAKLYSGFRNFTTPRVNSDLICHIL